MGSESAREALIAEFDRHVREEGDIIKGYHQLADELGDGPLRVLVNHIATDEEMHHFLLSTLSAWLQSPPDSSAGGDAEGLDLGAIQSQIRDLQAHETTTIENCSDLKKQLSDDEGEIFEVLLDTISIDSKKHHRLLGVISRMIK